MLSEIKKGILETRGRQLASEGFMQATAWLDIPDPGFIRLRESWSSYINSLMREWLTLNVVSVLLLTYEYRFITGRRVPNETSSASLTILQIDEARHNILSFGLISITCALMSTFYGCILIVGIDIMRPEYKAAEVAMVVGRAKSRYY